MGRDIFREFGFSSKKREIEVTFVESDKTMGDLSAYQAIIMCGRCGGVFYPRRTR